MRSTRINPYLNFNGNCREAMTFYRDCLGGRVDAPGRRRVTGGSPHAPRSTPEHHARHVAA